MYSPRSIQYGLKNPHKIIDELNRLIHTRLKTWNYNRRGIDILETEWDNLIILDACRFDVFTDLNAISGNLMTKTSRGSATEEFIRANFSDTKMHDTVCVTVNPWYLRIKEDINLEFHDMIYVPDQEFSDGHYINGYKKYTNQKPHYLLAPSAVTKCAEEANETYPNKRLIIHYLQPHAPFIAQDVINQLKKETANLHELSNYHTDGELIEFYEKNAAQVFDEVESLVSKLDGKTVVTSDHGEMLGERHDYIPIKSYGHPKGIYNDTLTKIPWLEVQSQTSKEIITEDPINEEKFDVERLNEHLEDLGYR